jgi:EAL domain-containing protein (putative c-di-GMP-specific phosphodiesterase class I)
MPATAGALLAPPLTVGDVLHDGGLTPHFQPLIDLEGGHVIGYEALIRGPRGSAIERPDALFAAAHEEGRVTELDCHCRIAAFRAAEAAGLGAGSTLFVNLEPAAVGRRGPADLHGAALAGPPGARVVIEITERSLTSDPAGLMRAVAELREQGFGIAIDDVGADDRSLALMPFLRPDVIKLDLALVQERPSVKMATILNAVGAEAERTGAQILAEGVETEEQIEIAHSLGATLAQGYLFGRPAPLPARLPAPEQALPMLGRSRHPASRTPFEVLQNGRRVRRGNKALLRSISRSLELDAESLGSSAVALATFQYAHNYTPPVQRTYSRLGERMAFVGVLGADVPPSPAPRVRGGHLGEHDPLRMEWDIAVLGPHFAAALAARDLGDTGPEDERRFDFVVSHNRELATEAARSLMSRIAPAAPVR